MAAVARGRVLPVDLVRVAQVDQVSKELRPAVALASAWVAQLARDEEVDAALLATRSDVVEFLSFKPEARLGQGWRAGLVGAPCASWPAVPRRWPWTATGACSWRTGRVTARGPERSGGTTPRLGGRFPAAGR